MARAALRLLAALVLAAPLLALAGPALAQCGPDNESPCPPPPDPVIPEVFNDPVFTPDLSPPEALLVGAAASPEATARIVARVERAFEFCTALVQREYVVDCLSERLDVLAQSLPDTGDYAEMKSALDQASKRLAAVVARNPSPTLPAGVATTQGAAAPEATTRPLTPVATEAVDSALAEAAAIIEETETVLLRSAGGSTDRAAAYQAVSGALETGTVLLRSA